MYEDHEHRCPWDGGVIHAERDLVGFRDDLDDHLDCQADLGVPTTTASETASEQTAKVASSQATTITGIEQIQKGPKLVSRRLAKCSWVRSITTTTATTTEQVK